MPGPWRSGEVVGFQVYSAAGTVLARHRPWACAPFSLIQFLSPPSELLSPCGRLSQARHGGCSDRVTLCWGVCPVHWWMFGSIPGLYPLNARNISTSLVVTSQTISRHCQVSPGSGIQESLSQMTVWIAELKTILLSLGLVGRVL